MTRVLLTGNHAVAWGARLARPRVVPVYPITPQTPVLELLTEFQAAGELDAEILTPESEHSVMAACIPASLAGVRVFTATASQGLMLMHELLHYASGARAPIVMANVNRTIASPWAFWPDQTDSLAQRDTGWIQLYVESAQEAFDSVVQAFRIAEQVLLPAMVNLDAFYVSHALEPVALPAQDLVDGYLPPYRPEHYLDAARGESWGNVVTQDMYYRHRRDIGAAARNRARDLVMEYLHRADGDVEVAMGIAELEAMYAAGREHVSDVWVAGRRLLRDGTIADSAANSPFRDLDTRGKLWQNSFRRRAES